MSASGINYRVVSPRNLRIHVIGKVRARVPTSEIEADVREQTYLYTKDELLSLLARMDQDTRVDAICRVAIKKKLATYGIAGVA